MNRHRERLFTQTMAATIRTRQLAHVLLDFLLYVFRVGFFVLCGKHGENPLKFTVALKKHVKSLGGKICNWLIDGKPVLRADLLKHLQLSGL